MAPPTPVREERRPWSWPERVAYWLYGFFIGPFLTRHADGTITGAMTRWAVAAFTVAQVTRLLARPPQPLGWPDAFVVFCILFALPIDNALSRAKPKEVLDLIGRPFGAASEAVDAGAQVTTTLQQKITPDPTPGAPAAEREQGEGDV